MVIMLVGNKVDLVEKQAQVYFDAAQEFAKLHGLFFAEASAVTTHNVEYTFEQLLQEMYDQTSKRREQSIETSMVGGIQARAPTLLEARSPAAATRGK
ncbi:unnamed protein product, partial [Effrenium voratum]